ncbi:hypothetical protein [Micromonospora sp. B9E7]|uniref:hypothetical protein n=1 Tax=Micromonospora sp. B9E7 TaxID=3153574 RepID=UPI00325ED0AA
MGEQRGAVEYGWGYGGDPEPMGLDDELNAYRLAGIALGGFHQRGDFLAPRLVGGDRGEIPAAAQEQLGARDSELKLTRESGLPGDRIT